MFFRLGEKILHTGQENNSTLNIIGHGLHGVHGFSANRVIHAIRVLFYVKTALWYNLKAL